ncbi:MAG: DUF6290 family protein [Succinivibrio sp.]|nr:DUF6290 family protein [Succinivibrio sp.]
MRLNSEEARLAREYAAVHGISLGAAFKRALFEKIEDEYDLRVAEDAYQEFAAEPITFSQEDAWQEIFKD